MAARRATTAQDLGPTDSQLLERDAALEAGQQALDSALEGAGALAAFKGPVGIGRSALLAALGHRAAEAGILSLRARCSEGEQQLAFGIVLNLFEQHVADLGRDELDSLFAGRAGVASSLLTGEGLRDPEALLRDAPGATLRLTHALYRVTANLASSEPVVLVVDDLQWADPESLQFLLYLAPRLAQISASLVVTVRDGVAPGAEAAVNDLIGAQSAHVDRLAPLGKRSVRKLVTEQSGACSTRCAEDVHWMTGGNPMLVHELIAGAREAGLPLDRASASEICEGAPDRIRHRVLGRIGEMREHEMAVARAAAVLGSTVDRQGVAAMTGLNHEALSSAAHTLESAGILDLGHSFDFVHPLVRAAVYSQIPCEERTHLHARAATVLNTQGAGPTAVATHLMRTRPHAQPWVVEELFKAARAARCDGELDRAILYLARALSEPPPAANLGDVLVELGRTQIDRGEIGPAVATLRRAADGAAEPRDAGAALELGRALCLNGDGREAADLLDLAIARDKCRNEAERDELEATWLAAALIEPSLRPEAGRRIKRMNGVERDHDSPPLFATVACHLVLTGQSRGRTVNLAAAALAGDAGGFGPATWAPALQALCWSGEIERACALEAELVGRPSVQHSRLALASVRLARAHSSHLAGRLEEAESEARAAVPLIDPGARTDYLDCAEARLAAILLDRGDLEGAEATIESITGAPYPEGSLVRAQILALRARIHSAHHRDAEALADATEAGRLLIAAGVRNPAVCGWRSQAAVAAAALGDRDRANQLADDELRLARRFGAAPAIGVALTAAGTIASGGEAVALLAEAEAVLDGSGARLEHARTLAFLGAALRHHGSQKKARATLTEALDAATSVNAEGVADLARSELRLAGGRPRRDATTGAAALTAAEQRVTELAADGLTNRAIAEELFVTKKTVEWHLHNSFRKLDVESRDELAQVLASDFEVIAVG